MRQLLATIILIGIGLLTSAHAQVVDRSVTGPPNKDIQLAVYLDVRPDCTSGPLPAIKLNVPPAHGTVTVKRAVVTATSYKQCLAIQVPAFVAFYRANTDFTGTDDVTLEIKFPRGRTEIQRIHVTVANSASEKRAQSTIREIGLSSRANQSPG